jgi:protein gp37
MSDLFHEDVPEDYIVAVAKVMQLAEWHTFQVLTKRSERLRDLLSSKLKFVAGLPHIWWGVSVEDRRFGLPRVEHLRDSPAGVRFLSVEPLLQDLGTVDLAGIEWVIVGGESGAGARPLQSAWVKSLRKQCARQGVAFFFKQWGGFQKKKAGRELDGRTYDAMPPLPKAAFPTEAERIRRVHEAEALAAQLERRGAHASARAARA